MGKNYELEYLKLENEKLKKKLSNYENKKSDFVNIKNILNLAVEMRKILVDCRKEQINIGLAKRIDNVLNEARKYD